MKKKNNNNKQLKKEIGFYSLTSFAFWRALRARQRVRRCCGVRRKRKRVSVRFAHSLPCCYVLGALFHQRLKDPSVASLPPPVFLVKARFRSLRSLPSVLLCSWRAVPPTAKRPVGRFAPSSCIPSESAFPFASLTPLRKHNGWYCGARGKIKPVFRSLRSLPYA